MSTDRDYRAEARAAMQMAVATACAPDRLNWVRLALAWHDLARAHEQNPGETFKQGTGSPLSSMQDRAPRGELGGLSLV
jgi:hypothetical protein